MTRMLNKVCGFFLLSFTLTGCLTPETLGNVHDASSKRDTICAFVDAWQGDSPELAHVAELCAASADLKEIAAAYAGCKVAE